MIRALLESGHRFSFFRAVQLLELSDPDAPPLGGAGPAREEAVRLRPDTSFTVPRAGVSEIREAGTTESGRRRFLVTETLMGLYGIRTPLPEIYAEEILRRFEEQDPVRDFLDLFHHRLLSFLYCGWAKSRAHVTFRRPNGTGRGATDPLTGIVFSVGGLAEEAVRQAAGLPPLGLLRYTAFFSRPARTAEGLERILSDALEGAPVRVEPYAARAVHVPDVQRSRLGRSGCALGSDFTLGERVEDRSGKFRLRVGPLDRPGYLDLAPGGAARAVTGALVHLYLLDPLEHDAMLGIFGGAKPQFRLSAPDGAPRLGIDTWLHEESPVDSWVLFPGFPARTGPATAATAAAAPGAAVHEESVA